ncbi:LysR substrate-binding domain-containing protein [Pyxidicoccus xibeiensis]|uniref:LysR substrate-binding domain-containing protein n=1 Tax=Pyxidicoccus xibeiensis TaxID=2906759 RepID=UPI0020A7E932|nr:LysR substrate-binding domain-containing protein [Pyxidicoccus xibeiensis]MCP3135953.1 LysR substrate-binding domain-containing protein [Pyxidicoccus xibeiensis]
MNLAPHPFTLRQLQYVVAVADLLSFRKAAERCHVSQPSLSAQVAQLEGVLGVQLFERDRRRVLLTTVGMELVERARRLLVEVDALMEAARRAGDPLSGTLRLGVIPTVSPYLLPAVTPTLRKRFPQLTLRWLEDKTEALARELERGVLDGALVALEAELGDVESAVLADDPFFLVTPKDHPLGQKKGDVLPSELRGEDVLLLDEGHCFREQALALCAKARAHELEFRATSFPTLTQMIASGAGVTLLPALAVSTEAKRSDLRVRPFAAPAPKRTLALIWRKRSPFRDALQEVAGAMREAWPRR